MSEDAQEAALGLLGLAPNSLLSTPTTTSPILPQPPSTNTTTTAQTDDISTESLDCICGFTNDDGYSIACDNCSRWCHMACFGISPRAVPDSWYCWECRPTNTVEELRERAIEIQRTKLKAEGVSIPGLPSGSSTTAQYDKGRRKHSPGVDKRHRKVGGGLDSTGVASGSGSGAGGANGPAGTTAGKRKRRPSMVVQPVQQTLTPEEEHIDIDTEPWTQAYVQVDKDIISNDETRARLRRHAQHWRGLTAVVEEATNIKELPLHLAQNPALSLYSNPNVVPPTYGLHAGDSIRCDRLIAAYRSTITPSSQYLADPLNSYAHLGLPKPFVHLIGPPLDVALDARQTGNQARFVRSGCRPNAVLRPFLCKKPQEEEADTALSFGVFALKDIERDEEIILGWEWDDGNVVHKLPALLNAPHTFPLDHSSFLDPSHTPMHHRPHHLERLRHQMANLLHALASTFTTCACGARANDCVITQMAAFVDGDEYPSLNTDNIAQPSHHHPLPPYLSQSPNLTPHPPHLSYSGVDQPKEPIDLGPLVGSQRGFRTRERKTGSGGIGGMEMVPPSDESDVEEPSRTRRRTREPSSPFSSRRASHPSLPAVYISPSSPHPTKDKGKGRQLNFEDGNENMTVDIEDIDVNGVSVKHRRKPTVSISTSTPPSTSSSPLLSTHQSHVPAFSAGFADLRPPDPGGYGDTYEQMVDQEERIPPKMRKGWMRRSVDKTKERVGLGIRFVDDLPGSSNREARYTQSPRPSNMQRTDMPPPPPPASSSIRSSSPTTFRYPRSFSSLPPPFSATSVAPSSTTFPGSNRTTPGSAQLGIPGLTATSTGPHIFSSLGTGVGLVSSPSLSFSQLSLTSPSLGVLGHGHANAHVNSAKSYPFPEPSRRLNGAELPTSMDQDVDVEMEDGVTAETVVSSSRDADVDGVEDEVEEEEEGSEPAVVSRKGKRGGAKPRSKAKPKQKDKEDKKLTRKASTRGRGRGGANGRGTKKVVLIDERGVQSEEEAEVRAKGDKEVEVEVADEETDVDVELEQGQQPPLMEQPSLPIQPDLQIQPQTPPRPISDAHSNHSRSPFESPTRIWEERYASPRDPDETESDDSSGPEPTRPAIDSDPSKPADEVWRGCESPIDPDSPMFVMAAEGEEEEVRISPQSPSPVPDEEEDVEPSAVWEKKETTNVMTTPLSPAFSPPSIHAEVEASTFVPVPPVSPSNPSQLPPGNSVLDIDMVSHSQLDIPAASPAPHNGCLTTTPEPRNTPLEEGDEHQVTPSLEPPPQSAKVKIPLKEYLARKRKEKEEEEQAKAKQEELKRESEMTAGDAVRNGDVEMGDEEHEQGELRQDERRSVEMSADFVLGDSFDALPKAVSVKDEDAEMTPVPSPGPAASSVSLLSRINGTHDPKSSTSVPIPSSDPSPPLISDQTCIQYTRQAKEEILDATIPGLKADFSSPPKPDASSYALSAPATSVYLIHTFSRSVSPMGPDLTANHARKGSQEDGEIGESSPPPTPSNRSVPDHFLPQFSYPNKDLLYSQPPLTRPPSSPAWTHRPGRSPITSHNIPIKQSLLSRTSTAAGSPPPPPSASSGSPSPIPGVPPSFPPASRSLTQRVFDPPKQPRSFSNAGRLNASSNISPAPGQSPAPTIPPRAPPSAPRALRNGSYRPPSAMSNANPGSGRASPSPNFGTSTSPSTDSFIRGGINDGRGGGNDRGSVYIPRGPSTSRDYIDSRGYRGRRGSGPGSGTPSGWNR